MNLKNTQTLKEGRLTYFFFNLIQFRPTFLDLSEMNRNVNFLQHHYLASLRISVILRNQ